MFPAYVSSGVSRLRYLRLKPAAVPLGRQRSALSVVITLNLSREGAGVLYLGRGVLAAAGVMYTSGAPAEETRASGFTEADKGGCMTQ